MKQTPVVQDANFSSFSPNSPNSRLLPTSLTVYACSPTANIPHPTPPNLQASDALLQSQFVRDWAGMNSVGVILGLGY